MLTLITGKTGAGKSYYSVTKIIDYLNSNKQKVITNIKISMEHKNYIYFDENKIKEFLKLIDEDFKDVEDFPKLVKKYKEHDLYGGAVFFLDECHLLGFRKYDDSLSNWLSVHRHFNQDIFLITQTTQKIHRNFLGEFQYWYQMIPSNKNITKNMLGYHLYDDVVTKSKIKTKYIKPDENVFDIYVTGKNDSKANPAVFKLMLVLGLLVSLAGGIIYFLNSGKLMPTHVTEKNKEIMNEMEIDDTNETSENKNNSDGKETELDKPRGVICGFYSKPPKKYIYKEKIKHGYKICKVKDLKYEL